MLESRVQKANLYDFDFACNEIRFNYKDKILNIEKNMNGNANINFDRHEWTKLVFGVSLPKYLIGYEGDKHEDIMNILFPECHPQFPEIDQF